MSLEELEYHHQALCFLRSMKMYPVFERGADGNESDGALEFAENTYWMGSRLSLFRERGIELQESGWCLLDSFADDSAILMDWCSTVLKRPKRMLENSVYELLPHNMKTFSGEQALRDEDGRALWKPIVNLRDGEGDPDHRVKGVGRYSSTRALLMDEKEGKQQTVWASRRRAMLDAWGGGRWPLYWVYGSVGRKNICPGDWWSYLGDG